MVGILEVLCSFNMLVRILERERKGTDAFAGSYFCVEVEVGTEEVACESGSSVVGRSGRKGRRTDGPDPFWTLMIVPSLCYTPVVRVVRIIIEPYSPTVSQLKNERAYERGDSPRYELSPGSSVLTPSGPTRYF